MKKNDDVDTRGRRRVAPIDSRTAATNEQRVGHTQTPWHTGGVFDPNGPNPTTNIWGPTPKRAHSGAIVAYDVGVTDAAFIVRACNVHDDLLAALKALRNIASANLCDIEECGCITSRVFRDADAAIAKAEGR